MKIISFGTETLEGQLEYDLSIFFELTDSDYNKLVKMDFYDVYQMYNHCKDVSVGYYNTQPFEEDDELGLSGSVFNHNDQYFITPEFSVNMN
jgi:hypothetical protein